MTTYAIIGKRGCWGSLTRYEDSLIARVDNASNKEQALELFRGASVARREYESEFQAVPLSKLTSSQKDWILNYAEEIHDAEKIPKSAQSLSVATS
jgi:hypothetical protein